MKLYRTGLAAGLLAGAVLLAACSSSKSSSDTTPPAATGGASSATDGGSSASGGGTPTCGSSSLTSDGSTAQQNAVNAWIKAYAQACPNAKVVYSGGGSGQGVTDFSTGKVNFAGSDSAMTADQIKTATANCGSPAINIPMVTGPVAVAFNVKGVTDLTLNPSVIAQIFTGKIKTWDDPAIKALNTGASLPSSNITVFYRSDSSGTTQNFETYLNTAAPSDYTSKPSKTWAGTGQGKTGSQGVQQALTSTADSIGYLEWSYAGNSGLSMAKVDNGGGAVALTAESAGAAVQAATNASQGGDDLTLKLDYATKTAGAYPIILVTYELVCEKYKDPSIGAAVKSFLTYTSSSAGQNLLTSVGSAPLPQAVLTQVQGVVAKIS